MEKYQVKPMTIHEKKYTPVSQRLMKLRVDYPGYDLHGEIMYTGTDEGGRCIEIIIRYVVSSGTKGGGDYHVHASGIAHERVTKGGVNSTSHVENCDTSAMGRALGCFGIGVDESFGSADEYLNAISQESASEATPPAAPVAPVASPLAAKRPLGVSEAEWRRESSAPVSSPPVDPVSPPYRGPYAQPKMQ